MKQYFLQNVFKVLAVQMFVGLLFSSFEPDITQSDHSAINKPLYVLTPQAPDEAERAAIDYFMYQQTFLEKLGLERDDGPIVLTRGFARYDAVNQEWLEEYDFPIMQNNTFIYEISVRKYDTGWSATESNFLNGSLNNLRVRTSEDKPAILFGLSYYENPLEAKAYPKNYLYWIKGTDSYLLEDAYISPSDKQEGYLIDMAQSIEKQLANGDIVIEAITQDSAIASKTASVKPSQTGKALSAERNVAANERFSSFLQPGETLDFELVPTVIEAEVMRFANPNELTYITWADIKAFAEDWQEKPDGYDYALECYLAMRAYHIPGIAEPCIAAFVIFCDKDGNIVSSCIETQVFDYGYKEGRKDEIFYTELTRSGLILETGGPYAVKTRFPARTSKEAWQKEIGQKCIEAGYQLLSNRRASAYALHQLGGIKVGESVQKHISKAFADNGWELEHDTDFFVMMDNSGFSLNERRLAEATSYNGGATTRVAHPYAEFLTNIYSYKAPLDDYIPRGLPVYHRKDLTDVYITLPKDGWFYAEQSYNTAKKQEMFWIDFMYATQWPRYYAWLLVTPSIPNKTTNQHERFFYPVTAKPAEIKADMQRYCKENGV